MTRQYIENYLQTNHIFVQDSIDSSDLDLLIAFAKIGVGVACVIRSFVKKELSDGTLIEIPLEIPIPKREVGFVYKNQTTQTRSLEQFISFYKNYTPVVQESK